MSESEPERASVGPYEVLETVSRGGMGAVYRGRHEETGQEVILKVPRGEAYAEVALEREGEVLEGLDHPNIMGLVERGPGWLALDVAEGAPLPLAHPGLLSEDELVTRLGPFVGLCHALAHLHGLGWVHSDLSPNNLMVDAAGHLTLIDFGLVTRFGHRPGLEDLERAGTRAGTLAYTSPEALEGARLDARSDLYALGCLLYEQLTGAPPFRGTRDEVVQGHLRSRPARLPGELPIELGRVVTRLLSKQASRRPGHAFAVLEALVACGVPASVPPRPPRPYLVAPALEGVDAGLEQWEAALAVGEPRAWGLTGPPGSGKSSVAFEMVRRARWAGLEVVTSSRQERGVLGVFSELVPEDETPRDPLKAAEGLHAAVSSDRLLVVEDAERLSERSVYALEHLLTHGQLWMIVCSREELDAQRYDRVLVMEPLDAPQQERMIRSALGGMRVPEALDAFISTRSGGNPWLVLEHLRALRDEELLAFDNDGACRFDMPEGTLYAELDRLSTPDAVAALLRERFERLPPRARSACALLAVAGRALARDAFPDALALEEALESGMVLERVEVVEWGNPSMAEVVAAAMDDDERASASAHALEHLDLDLDARARLLEVSGRRDLASRAYERAGEAALEDHDVNVARRHLLAASSLSDDARRRFALAERVIVSCMFANRIHGAAFELLDDVRPGLPEDLAPRWHLMRGRTCLCAGDASGALVEFEACASARDLDDLELAAQLRKARGVAYAMLGDNDRAHEEYLSALASFRSIPNPLRVADTLLNLFVTENSMGRSEEALEHAIEAREIYQSLGSPMQMLVSWSMGSVLRYMGRCDEELELLVDVVEHYRRHGGYARESTCEESMAICLHYLGRLSESWKIFARLADRAPPYCVEKTTMASRFWLAWIASTRGDLASSNAHADVYVAYYTGPEYYYKNLPGIYLRALVLALGGDVTGAKVALDAAQAATPESLDAYFRPVLSKLNAHTLYLCGAHDRVLEIVEDEVSSRQAGVHPRRELFWCVLGACVKFSRGTLEPSELDALRALRGYDRLSDVRLGLLYARFALERGDVERAREELDWAGELCETEGLTLELMTLWRLEAMIARARGEDDGDARAELAALEASAPPGLLELAWWPPSPPRSDD